MPGCEIVRHWLATSQLEEYLFRTRRRSRSAVHRLVDELSHLFKPPVRTAEAALAARIATAR